MKDREAFQYLKELEKEGISLGLERVQKFLSLLGNPQDGFKSIHVAGTNGKGSTAAIIASILQKAGFKTGLYTSPHLIEFNERILVNGEAIPSKELEKLVSKLRVLKEKHGLKLTYFEFVTALAFQYFAERKVGFAVVEVGMGGRLDATNILKPRLCIVTNVEKEHEAFLGKTVEKIAVEKAGIIKEKTPVVTAEWKQPVLNVLGEKCKEKHSTLRLVKKPFEGKMHLLGSFQKWNAATAISAIEELRKQGFEISEKAVESGLAAVNWRGRFEVVQRNPTVVLDCCHNPSGAFVLAKAFGEAFPGKKAVLVVGVSSDKKIDAIASNLAPIAETVVVTEAAHRAMPARKIKESFERQGKDAIVVPGVKEAVVKGIEAAGEHGIVLVCGSCFVVGEAMQLFSE